MSDAVISEREDVFTVVVDIHVEPEAQARFAGRLGEMIETFTQHQPGFVSSAIHKSEDGTRLLNYSQWRDRASYEHFIEHPEAKRHIADLETIAQSLTPHVMPPVAVHAAAPSR